MFATYHAVQPSQNVNPHEAPPCDILAELVPTTLALLDNGDLDLRDGRGPLLVAGAEAAKSFLIAIFSVQAGTWVFNLEFGVRYNDAILGRYFDEITAAGLYAADASGAPGVAPVPTDNVSFTLDPVLRKLSAVIAPVILLDGSVLESFAVPIV